MTFNSQRPAKTMEVDDHDSTVDTQSVVSVTEVPHSHSQGSLPIPPPSDFMARHRVRAKSPGVALSIVRRNRIQRIERILGRFDPMLPTSLDAQHLSLNSLSTKALTMAHELNTIKDHLRLGQA